MIKIPMGTEVFHRNGGAPWTIRAQKGTGQNDGTGNILHDVILERTTKKGLETKVVSETDFHAQFSTTKPARREKQPDAEETHGEE